jgi:hypothetical protein
MKIYLSKSNLCSLDQVEAIVKVIEQNENECVQYTGGHYDTSILLSCKSVVCVTPEPVEEKFLVGRGQHSEIKLALDNKKPIFLYYQKQFYPIIGIDEYNVNNWKVEYGRISVGNEIIPNFIINEGAA